MTIPDNSASENQLTNQPERLEPEAIRAQLARIMASQEFESSTQLMGFLYYIVEETLAGRSQRISQKPIAVNAFGRPSHFDPRTDPIVRIEARRLRRGLAYYYENEGRDDPIRIHIPKGGYVPVFTPNNSHPGRTAMDAQPGTTPSSALETGMPGHDGPAIAVLPLEYLGSEAEYAFLASGITEEIVIALTRFPEFVVVGPLDREIIRAQRLDLRGIGSEYNVRFILDGTVRLRGQNLHLTAKLSDAINGHKLWGDAYHYDIETTSVDQIENEIVGKVAATIADNFGIIPRILSKEVFSRRDDSLSDYEAILKFYHHVRVLTEQSGNEAIVALERMIERKPDHDLAMGLLADMRAGPYFLGFVDDTSSFDASERLARKALALNPNSQAARFAMAQVHYLRFEQAPFLVEITRLLESNPNDSNNLAVSALFLAGVGQWEWSLGLIERAMRLNPHHPGWYHLVPYLLHYYQGEFETALVSAKGFNNPDYFWDPLIRMAVYGQLGRQKKAREAEAELLELVPDFALRGHSLIKRMLFLDEHVDMFLDGLRKAGLELSPGTV